MWEIDSINAGDVFEKLGEAAGQLSELGILKGHLWMGKAAETVGEVIDALGNSEDSIGTDSQIVPLGISGVYNPTTKYRYRTLYETRQTDDFQCYGTPQQVAWERLSDPTLDETTREFYQLVSLGWDADHPFTMSPAESLVRLALLQSAIDLSDELEFEAENHPGMEHLPGVYKGGTLALACNALETEVDEAMALEIVPEWVLDANAALEAGRALARDGQHDLALTTCFEYIPELLRLNHPTVFWDGFEKSDTRMWTATVSEVIIID